tara:strand:+ start:752 stop:1186 length:435 start_codon:yes stop_codon:yes gene_type:complete
LNKNKFLTTRSSGFTLIELLVVVAIIGILAAIGVVAYNGYVDSTKKKSTENIMMQIGLAQTEYYSDFGIYYHPGASCTPTAATSRAVEKELLGGDGLTPSIITEDLGFEICVHQSGSSYLIKAQNGSGCKISVDSKQAALRENC